MDSHSSTNQTNGLKFIQVFNRYLNPGGEEKSVARIGCDLEAGGHKVVRFWKESIEWKGAGAPSKIKQPFLMWSNPAVLNELRHLQEREKADAWVLHNVLPVISLGIYRLARQLKIPVIQWLHNYRPLSPSGTLMIRNRQLRPDDPFIYLKETLAGTWRGRLLTGWLSLGYAKAERAGDFDAVRAWIAVSDEMRAIFLKAGFPSDRLFTLRHSWHIEPAPPEIRDEGHFLFLGRMVEAKGIRFLINLWNNPALERIPLVMAGQGDLVESLKAISPSHVRWVGHVEGEEKRRLIAGCRGIVFPSIWPEPLSTVAYEAYQMKKPILASNLGGMKEIVFDGQTGRLLEPENHGVWLDAVRSMDSAQAARWGTAGRQWLDEHVSTASWNRQFDGIIGQVLR